MIVLDKHAWLWWADSPERLSPVARHAIDEADGIGVATISCWEVAMLVVKRRIALATPTRSWIRQALAQPGIRVLSLEAAPALEAALLEAPFADDPADRIIYATARAHGAGLVTRDARMREYDPRGTVW